MASLPGFEFRRRFSQLFEINPSLTNNEAYTILEASSFDVPKTCLEIAKKKQESIQEREFWIPKRALEQLEVSERPEKKIKSSQKTEQSQLKIIINNKLPDQEIESSRITQVKIREIIEIDDSDDEQDVFRNDAEPCAIELDQVATGSRREFLNIEISDESDVDKESSEDESDSEIDYGSQKSRSGFDSHMRSVEKLKSAESIKSIKPIKPIKPDKSTLATPFVSKVAGNVFDRELKTIQINKDQTSAESDAKEYHEEVSSAHSAAQQFLRGSQKNLAECQAACRAGDSILVQDAKIESKVHCAFIVYLYKENEEPMAHIRYFERGCDTIIGEMASPRVLFMTSRCANISKAEIRAKIRVDFRGKVDDANDSTIDLTEEEYHRSPDRYLYRLGYDSLLQSFSEAKEMVTGARESGFEKCECCSLERVNDHQPLRILNWNKTQQCATGFIYKGTKYQLKDFIYFISKPTSGSKGPQPYSIGQIQKIKVICLKGQPSVNLTVDSYERYDDHFRLKRSEETDERIPFAIHDNRRVFRWKSKSLNPKDVDGHCFVRHIEQIEDLDIYKDLNDTFWVQEYIPNDLKKDSITVGNLKFMPKEHLTFSKGNEQRLERERKQEMTKMDGLKLNTLEIYSGAGGLKKGFHESGVIGTSYAVEFDTTACETFKLNFPDADVYNDDAGKFLERAMKIEAGLLRNMAHDIDGEKILKMPKKGDIDMIVGGPPCQGWSKVNRKNNPEKLLKNPICPMRESIATFLSYVDFYRPKYCLLENVTGLKHHPLNGTDIPDCTSDNGLLTDGAIKFIFRVFTSLGYQCQHTTLQVGAYGVPSSRKRVIFWASLPGYKLPKFPEPTNVFSRIPKDSPYIRRSAPHRPLTIQHCISDLPQWELENPHTEIQQTPEQKSSQTNRGKSIAQYSILKNQKFVGLEKQDYASPHLCEFQRISVKQAERMCNIPLEAGADYRRMNEALLPNHLRKESERFRKNSNYRNRKFEGKYGRLFEDEIFKIITTANDQYSTNSWMLNPKLHRPYTIRELARAMGFPDSFIWDLETMKVSDALKQIGNAVPPPFARALGNELRKVLQDRNTSTSRESNDDEDIAIDDHADHADQTMNLFEEMLAGSETDSDEEIDHLVIAQLEKEFNRNTDKQTDAGREDKNEENSDTEEEVSDDSDVGVDADMKDHEDQEDPESENEDKQNWSVDEEIFGKSDDSPESEDENEQNLGTDEEIPSDSEVEVDEDMEGQAGQENLESEDESGRHLDADEKATEESDVDSDEDMDDLDDLESADENETNENIDSEEESWVNKKVQREERINTGGSRDNAIVIDDSE
ncbi:uncharacterized protein EAE97_006602 [Botrytis byssoidea]|uniref:Cytosine-specific methyltransferase n=1 Tax=Botrytis byssoidea TaxID=139641 RepID=A0A9P5II01_9HELO|nr:uncharacterized protein EAE97_006602 [Botrytis byssoidea]KAF7941765.1 hypothetical protein EAE97_006602 [Botrytis byssoidea]